VLLLLKTARAFPFDSFLMDGLSTMVAVSTAAEEIKIYDSGSRSVDCSCETFYGTNVLLLVLWLDFFFFLVCM